MLIYLASRYSRFREMQGYRDQLEAAGHKVTSRWINGDHQIDDAGLSLQAKEAERIRFAQEDRDDLVAADCVISFTEAPRSSNSRGGRHVEYGIALALKKRVLVVGHRENVFHCLPEAEFYGSWPEALGAIDQLRDRHMNERESDWPKIPAPFLPADLEDAAEGRRLASHEWSAQALEELARQLGVGNDFYYPLRGAAQKLREPGRVNAATEIAPAVKP